MNGRTDSCRYFLVMKDYLKLSLIILVLVLVSCKEKEQEPNISIFCDSIASIARQEGISFADAASRIRNIGYSGVDVWVNQDSAQLAVIDSLGFRHASAISMIRYSDANQKETEKRTLEFMKAQNFDKVLLVPGLLPEGASAEHLDSVRRVIAKFASAAKAERLTVMVEDYDNPSSICYNTALLEKMFKQAPDLGMVFDTGNFLFAGEDCLDALSLFAPMVCHVHLKDRKSAFDRNCPAPGTGCIPMEEIIKPLIKAGYDGWFTVEFSSGRMLEDAAIAYDKISGYVLSQRKDSPEE